MKKLWRASKNQILNSNLMQYEKFIKDKYHLNFKSNYDKIFNWSIKHKGNFWDSIWDFCKVKGLKGKHKIKSSKIFYKNLFLTDYKLNFAENILVKSDNSKAITFISENGFREERSWFQLNQNVSKIISYFNKIGIKKGDRVSAYLPNIIQTVESFVATSAIGAIWSSCSPDFGLNGLVERFAQIKPKILIIGDRYYYNGKEINVIERLPDILKRIKSIKHILVINYPGKKYLNFKKSKGIKFKFWKEIERYSSSSINFKKFNFNTEIAILYSSGTTGKPKCICHRSGGILLQHLKEHQLHSNIKENDNIFYFTTCGWMMWNWLVTCLGSKASIVLFDGFPMFKQKDLLLNVHLASISGGTDLVSCFVLGNIYKSVISGEIQSKGLGMDVDIFNESGKSVKNIKGELVCKTPFPSMPTKFWNDKNNKKFQNAYFNRYKNIWHHGDYGEIKNSGGFLIYGRSDATLNPGGVRLGTAEIYSEVEKFKEIKESIVVGQSWDNDIRIILFVVLNNGVTLNDELIKKIKQQIRINASPRHVPNKIFKVNDIPRTKNGKIVELAVKNIIEGNTIKNKEALANPEVLEEYTQIKELYEFKKN